MCYVFFGRLNLYTLFLNSETDGQEKDVEPTYDAYDANIQPVIEEEAGEKNDQQGMYRDILIDEPVVTY